MPKKRQRSYKPPGLSTMAGDFTSTSSTAPATAAESSSQGCNSGHQGKQDEAGLAKHLQSHPAKVATSNHVDHKCGTFAPDKDDGPVKAEGNDSNVGRVSSHSSVGETKHTNNGKANHSNNGRTNHSKNGKGSHSNNGKGSTSVRRRQRDSEKCWECLRDDKFCTGGEKGVRACDRCNRRRSRVCSFFPNGQPLVKPTRLNDPSPEFVATLVRKRQLPAARDA